MENNRNDKFWISGKIKSKDNNSLFFVKFKFFSFLSLYFIVFIIFDLLLCSYFNNKYIVNLFTIILFTLFIYLCKYIKEGNKYYVSLLDSLMEIYNLSTPKFIEVFYLSIAIFLTICIISLLLYIMNLCFMLGIKYILG